MTTTTTTAQVLAEYQTPEGLVAGFYYSFADEEEFKGTAETIEWARGVVEAGDRMWNWPSVVADAEAYIAGNS